MNTMLYRLTLVVALLIAGLMQVQAEETTDNQQASSQLDDKIQSLKDEVLDLNRDLFLLEEELLFPANTQFTVFVSMDVGMTFNLDSVQLRLDNTPVANYLYTDREVAALQRGGVQRFYIGNLASGEHELVAIFIGKGPNGRDYKRGTTMKISKTGNPQFVELKITDNTAKQQPEFSVKVWEQ
jgi:hypothetical protein